MKSVFAFSAIVSAATASVEMNIATQPRSHSQMQRSRRSLVDRQDSTSSPIEESVINILPWYSGGAFYMNVSVGTPGQVMTVDLYTVSSVTYFDAQDSNECQSDVYNDGYGDRLCAGGSFQTNFSATYRVDVADGFNYTEDNFVVATGDLASDIVQIGSVEIANLRFGVAKTNVAEAGAIGLGYGLNYDSATDNPYRSFLQQLQAAGTVNSQLYSVLLNASGAPTGSILFGGLNLDYFAGELVTIDFLPSPTDWAGVTVTDGKTAIVGVTQPIIAITDIGVTYGNATRVAVYDYGDPSGQAKSSLPSVLDLSAEWWAIPFEAYDTISALIPGLNGTTRILPCEASNENINITVGFANLITIDVPLANLVVPIFTPGGLQNTTSEGQPLCNIALYPSNGSLSDPYSLGSGVMRSMYLIFDLDNAQVSIAQAASSFCQFYGCGTIVDVPAGPNGIARALSANYVSSVTIATASSNTGLVQELITATGISDSISPVARTTDDHVGTVTGNAALPTDGTAIPQTVLSSGPLSSATRSEPSPIDATAAASGTVSHTAAAYRLSQPIFADVMLLPSVVCTAAIAMGLAIML